MLSRTLNKPIGAKSIKWSIMSRMNMLAICEVNAIERRATVSERNHWEFESPQTTQDISNFFAMKINYLRKGIVIFIFVKLLYVKGNNSMWIIRLNIGHIKNAHTIQVKDFCGQQKCAVMRNCGNGHRKWSWSIVKDWKSFTNE
jgi:hypothetical protein